MLKKIFYSVIIILSVLFSSCADGNMDKPVKNSDITIQVRQAKSTFIINRTYLGNERRYFYGNYAPSHLNIKWKHLLGTGKTWVGTIHKTWSGAGWTGQPLMIKYNDTLYIIQGAYDHNLKKIRVSDGKLMNEFEFDDVIKGTGSIWRNPNPTSPDDEFYIMQGSRRGAMYSSDSKVVQSYKCIAFRSFQKKWIYSSKKMRSYSRDVDGSALIVNDTAYLGLENGLFIVFDPNPNHAEMRDGVLQPFIYDVDTLFYASDANTHGGNLVTESSPSYLNGYVYITSGSGHLFGYNIKKKEIDWVFDTEADMDGSPIVTDDECLIITIEKEYIPGQGGAMKINPSLSPDECVVWYFPTETKTHAYWAGGIIGSASINDYYAADTMPKLSAFLAIDGNLYVVRHDKIAENKTTKGPMLKHTYPMPELAFKYHTGPSISTPIIVGNKIIAPTYEGIYLFEFDKDMNFKLLQHQDLGSFEATPFVWDGRIYVACRDGNLYCFGD
ncbi:MAG: hypothetical protein JXL97_19485 [Bacteroidales bacterium]|nr:hypothetical protein [Bacteroidales bacterium]